MAVALEGATKETKLFKAANLVVLENAPRASSSSSSSRAAPKAAPVAKLGEPGAIWGSVADATAAEVTGARMQVQLLAAIQADQEWAREHKIVDWDLPRDCKGIDRIWWHLDRNVCEGDLHKSKQAKYAIAHMARSSGDEAELPLDDGRLIPRIANFLKAFRSATPSS